ncbi:MAG: conjugal transfer protein [Clostridiales bacterium 52_15]|nr:MAG: conjugal transfer protein [Clostridiales bacterium 52_15]
MQDEVNAKVVALMIKGGKISGEVLKKALDKFVEELEKAQKQMSQPKTYRGKQSVKHLVQQNAAISNIEVTDGNIKSFERTANKYGIDFALKKDTSEQPPRYLVFFKGRDVDVMTAAFKEFSAKKVKQQEKPSLRQKLSRKKEQTKAQHKEKVKVKTKDRGVEL